MRITDSTSLALGRRLDQTGRAISRALERLSTGRRVNSPGDDLASFSISQELDSRIRGLNQVNLGINQAAGLLSSADSAISSLTDIAQQMREIAFQGANELLSESDRSALNSRLSSLRDEYQRIVLNTEFAGSKLLDGSADGLSILLSDQPSDDYEFDLDSVLATDVFQDVYGTGTFSLLGTESATSGSVSVGDLNGDGLDDTLTSELNARISNGEGGFTAKSLTISITDRESSLIADVNNDGANDVIVTRDGSSDQVDIYLNDGNVNFKLAGSYSTGNDPGKIATGDFDGDGNLDFATVNRSTDDVSVFFGQGNGFFDNQQTLDLDADAASIAIGDINNDGFDDLIGAAQISTNYLSVYLSNGDGTFGARSTIDLGTRHSDIELADVDDDGNLDLITANLTSGNIAIRLGLGDGTFGSSTAFGVSSSEVTDVEVGDVNGDGIIDLIAGLKNSDGYAIFIGRGDGQFDLETEFTTLSGDVSVLSAGDFNGDGLTDFMLREFTNSYQYVFQANSSLQSGLQYLNANSSREAGLALGLIDNALEKLTSARSDISTALGRLETATSYNLLLSENYEDSQSRLVDADFAVETAELVRNQILQQAQIASLAQSNTNQAVILGLLDRL